MMTTVQIQVTGEHPPPTDNPIDLYAIEVKHTDTLGAFSEVICSPKVWIPNDLKIDVTTALPGLYILSHSVWDGQIKLVVMTGQDFQGELKGFVAYATISDRAKARIRFMQKDTKGRRIVTGEAKPVENRDTTPDSQPGE